MEPVLKALILTWGWEYVTIKPGTLLSHALTAAWHSSEGARG